MWIMCHLPGEDVFNRTVKTTEIMTWGNLDIFTQAISNDFHKKRRSSY